MNYIDRIHLLKSLGVKHFNTLIFLQFYSQAIYRTHEEHSLWLDTGHGRINDESGRVRPKSEEGVEEADRLPSEMENEWFLTVADQAS